MSVADSMLVDEKDTAAQGASEVVRDLSARETLRLVQRSLKFVWPYRRQVAVKLALSLVGLVLILFLPWPMKILVDHVVMGMPINESPTPFPPFVQPFVNLLDGLSPFEILWVIVGVGVAGIVLIGGFGTGASRDQASDGLAQGLDTATQSENEANISNSRVSGLLGLFEYRYQLRTTHRINHTLREAVYGKLLALPLLRFSDASIGDAVYRVMYDTPSISKVCYDILVLPIVNLFVIAAAIWTLQYSFGDVPTLVVIAWLAAPIMLAITFLLTGVTRRRSLASRAAGAQTTATIEEGMSNIVAVQSLGANSRQRDDFADDSENSFRRFRLYTLVTLFLGALQTIVVLTLVFYVFFEVTEALVDERMSAGDYAVLYTYFIQIAGSAAGLGAIWFNLQNNVAGMQRVFQVLDMPADSDSFGTVTPATDLQTVELDHVSYRYGGDKNVLEDVSLTARVGEMIALVGATGAGKTTLAYTLAGFIRPDSGVVRFDGHDLADLDAAWIRRQVSFVFQEPAIFDDSVTNNLKVANLQATPEQIEHAARTAGALSFVEDLPQGFSTRLGRSGNTLSVGQKQRLAIARGLVSNAPVLVLDEPTAALDPETEAALVTALQAERERRVLVVIAHRLSTIRTADRIVFVDDGRIVESGSHDELMAVADGAYRGYVEMQQAASTTR